MSLGKNELTNCYETHNNDPYLILRPAKVEVLLHDPKVLYIHDVIRDSVIKQLKKEAQSLVSLAEPFVTKRLCHFHKTFLSLKPSSPLWFVTNQIQISKIPTLQ